MNDGILSAVTKTPLASPIRAPQPMPVAIPSIAESVALITVAAKHADNPMFAPTERSRPAVRMTNVRPEAIRNKSAVCRSTLKMLFAVKKTSLRVARIAHSSAAASRR